MKVLIYDTTQAFLSPGGKTTHALKLQSEIAKLGVDIDFSRWWDRSQENADIIHFLTPDMHVAKMAKERGIMTFFSMIFDFESNKTENGKRIAILKNKIVDVIPRLSASGAYWKALPYMDKIQFMHQYDKQNALRYFPKYIDEKKTVIIPHAYDPNEMNISRGLDIKDMHLPDKYLVSVANISPRKQTVKLARLAKKAEVPIVFLGNRCLTDSYFKEFEKCIDNQYVFYPGFVSKEWKDLLLNNSMGFVLLSLGESGCIAVYEAAAYRVPLLLSDLPWAWGYDSPTDIYFCCQQDEKKAVVQLRSFFEKAEKLDHTPYTIHTWTEIANLYIKQYQQLLNMKSERLYTIR